MTPFEKTKKIINETETVEELRKIVGRVKTSTKISDSERGQLVSLVEVRRNYLDFELHDDYL